jgi:hypothetical protein
MASGGLGTYIFTMRKGGGGLGMIVVLVAVLIVMLLVARAWNDMAPTALQVTQPGSEDSSDRIFADEEDYNSPGHLPNLEEMNQRTTQHEEDVRQAMEQTD